MNSKGISPIFFQYKVSMYYFTLKKKSPNSLIIIQVFPLFKSKMWILLQKSTNYEGIWTIFFKYEVDIYTQKTSPNYFIIDGITTFFTQKYEFCSKMP